MKYIITLILLLSVQHASANLIINEVLSNEPGSSTSLEWIELYNDSDSSQQLSDFILVINSKTIALPAQLINADSYIILCKKLYAPINDLSFENYWGNGSQIWGDSKFELLSPEPIELTFSLPNDSGFIQLIRAEIIVSSFMWSENSDDGISWERKFVDSSIILQSKSNQYATPGYLNSISLAETDLAIEAVAVEMIEFVPYYTFTFSNRGFSDIIECALHIYDSTNHLVQSILLPPISSDSLLEFEISFSINSINCYNSFTAIVTTSHDVRNENDSLLFMIVSQSYPPIVISEFLANPQSGVATEWIEIYNRSSEAIDLQNWYIGDELNVYAISSEQNLIPPNSYGVLYRPDIAIEYPNFTGHIIELDKWAILNNDSDKIRLVDKYNIEADSYYYDKLYDENYTIARELQNDSYRWGRSSIPFGTPGYENELFFFDKNLKIKLSSKYISPNDDGFEDELQIEVEVPQSENYTLKIYNVNGNIVKSFYADKELISNKTIWNGLDDQNRKLPIGIYILYLTTSDGLSAKETLVIAR